MVVSRDPSRFRSVAERPSAGDAERPSAGESISACGNRRRADACRGGKDVLHVALLGTRHVPAKMRSTRHAQNSCVKW